MLGKWEWAPGTHCTCEIPLVTCILLHYTELRAFFSLSAKRPQLKGPAVLTSKPPICVQRHIWEVLKSELLDFIILFTVTVTVDFKGKDCIIYVQEDCIIYVGTAFTWIEQMKKCCKWTAECFLALLPCLPRFCSLVCAQYNTQKYNTWNTGFHALYWTQTEEQKR